MNHPNVDALREILRNSDFDCAFTAVSTENHKVALMFTLREHPLSFISNTISFNTVEVATSSEDFATYF